MVFQYFSDNCSISYCSSGVWKKCNFMRSKKRVFFMQCKIDILQICNILVMYKASGGKMRKKMVQTVRNRRWSLQVVAAACWCVSYVFQLLKSCFFLDIWLSFTEIPLLNSYSGKTPDWYFFHHYPLPSYLLKLIKVVHKLQPKEWSTIHYPKI